ncbi:hypothetical protein [Pseudoxanthomonas wuyuanensis]|uniref:Uncharacterized protein n=1 Tax=Pseudoxanthomonas wuyuanensis TaxID=1073196 RepID=A0A286D4T9_9GAMM|nr:hypothetical protein [Pseudoxanthomonas wuyuanensis]KAF1719803.1 hypothetical protein CSC75_14040 [Pseudoxanthomonas wuyuanensis]SOD53669.1 hypothetical protein SAMN06296416_102528 [Pseudoxanthomonas wuyuanensis]
MAKNFTSGGVDFDDLFDPDIMGDGPAAPWLTSGGVALKYAALSYGSKRANVGFTSSTGVDVSNLWAAKGSAVYVIEGLHGKGLHASEQALTNQQTVSAQVSVALRSDGTWAVFGATTRGSFPQSAPTSGTWLPSGQSASGYQVQFEVVSSGSADRRVTTSAATYQSLSATQTVGFVLPDFSAVNATERSASATITIRLRRVSTGTVSTTVLSAYLSTTGYT